MSASERRIAEMRERYLEGEGEMFDIILSACESPIEKMFVAAMLLGRSVDTSGNTTSLAPCEFADRVPRSGLTGARTMAFGLPDNLALCVLQAGVEIGPWRCRIDIALLSILPDGDAMVAVELDGHDFHERTKEQARRDKSRDRRLQAAGWRAIRFTGSEVFEDPHACAREALALFDRTFMADVRARDRR